MSEIGHNLPPAEKHAQAIDELFELVSDSTSGGQVTTDEQDAALDSLLDDIRKARKAADADRVAEKKPHDEAGKAVQAAYKPVLDKADTAMAEIKRLLTPYRTAKQRAKDEAARKAREEAEAKERAAREALETSDDLTERFEAESQLAQAKKLTSVANKIDRTATGLRSRQVAVVTDRRALLEYVMRNDADTLTAWLSDYAQRALPSQLPGVTIEREQVAA